MGGKDRLPITDAATMVAERVARARAAQAAFDGATQEEVDEVVTAVGWDGRCGVISRARSENA